MKKLKKIMCLIIATVLIFSVSSVGVNALKGNEVTVYFLNSLGWEKVYAYEVTSYGDDTRLAFPGTEMDLIDEEAGLYSCTIKGTDYNFYFNSGTWDSTSSLLGGYYAADRYYEPYTDECYDTLEEAISNAPKESEYDYYIVGDEKLCNGVNWKKSASNGMVYDDVDDTYYAVLKNIPNGEYHFMIVDTYGNYVYNYDDASVLWSVTIDDEIREQGNVYIAYSKAKNYPLISINAIPKYPTSNFYSDGDYVYTLSGNSANIYSYTGKDNIINFPKKLGNYTVKSIDNFIFEKNDNIPNISSVTIPDTVTTVSPYAFDGTSSDFKIFGGQNVNWIPYNYSDRFIESYFKTSDFYCGVYENGEIIILSYIGENKNVVVPSAIKNSSVTAIGYLAFMGDKIITVSLPSSIKYISTYSFSLCDKLTDIFEIPCTAFIDNDSFKNTTNIMKMHQVVIDEAVEPTKTSTGLTEGTHCSLCSEIFEEQIVIPKISTKVSLSKYPESIYVKGTYKINADVTNGNGKTTFSSSNPKIAKVSQKGKITGLRKGTAKITVNNNGVKKTFTVTVKNPKLNKTSLTLKKGESFNIKITGQIGTAKFTADNSKIAKVNSKGKITAKSIGNTKIYVVSNGVTLKCNITVK